MATIYPVVQNKFSIKVQTHTIVRANINVIDASWRLDIALKQNYDLVRKPRIKYRPVPPVVRNIWNRS